MASDTQIANIALTRMGVDKAIANLTTEQSKEAALIRRIYEDERKYVLRDFPWPWASAYAEPGLVGGSASEAVNGDWQYSYRYPPDCLFVRRIVRASKGREDPHPPPFRVGRDASGRLIFTDETEIEIEYTVDVTDPEEYDTMFVSMLAWKLAAVAAPAMSRVKDMSQTAMQMYEIDKTKAQSRALNEGQDPPALEAEWILDR